MSLIKWNNGNDLVPSFSGLFDDFFGSNANDFLGGSSLSSRIPSVNIAEDENSFEVEVAAPGLRKKDFKVNIEGNILTISAERTEDKEKRAKKRVTRREFNYTSFQRSFTLPESVDAEDIEANYEEGVLRLVLPKKEEAKKKLPREISIG